MRTETLVTSLLGKRCERTVLLGRGGYEWLKERLGAVDVLSRDGASVFDIRAARLAAPEALLVVDNSHAGSRISPACMRGADVVLDDLSALIDGADVCAASWARGCGIEAVDLVRCAAETWTADPDGVDAVDEAALAYERTDRARNDMARVLAPYLACHPAVADVTYAGLGELAGHARRVFEKGFGNRVRIELACDGDARAVASVFHTSDASGRMEVLADDVLLYLAGPGDPTLEIAAFEEALKIGQTGE